MYNESSHQKTAQPNQHHLQLSMSVVHETFPWRGNIQMLTMNFLALCASCYYDGTIFHRNIKGFMIQGGDPTGTGKGGTSIWGKKFSDEIRESLKHNARGMLSMANSGPNTNGSQFFITYAKQPHLNGLYTIFGKVIHGFEVLDIMEKDDVTCSGFESRWGRDREKSLRDSEFLLAREEAMVSEWPVIEVSGGSNGVFARVVVGHDEKPVTVYEFAIYHGEGGMAVDQRSWIMP
ncbi:Peptidyl-prolyl cis-trans isomerase-like 2 [Platanthera zijinensis]|uniref:Peptidyl-prolyl cis-trans isomerase n=1 Tax=Platanthera zijinensis TaxID=2320716 RepID=A0AAP0BNQ3_9ASPA